LKERLNIYEIKKAQTMLDVYYPLRYLAIIDLFPFFKKMCGCESSKKVFKNQNKRTERVENIVTLL